MLLIVHMQKGFLLYWLEKPDVLKSCRSAVNFYSLQSLQLTATRSARVASVHLSGKPAERLKVILSALHDDD